jgi:hypothetical protein
MAANGISTELVNGDPVATKLLRRNNKLALAATKRQTVGTNGYRPLNQISTSSTHVAYVGTSTHTASGTASPIIGHPWGEL